jgi:ATP-dependent Lon protease
MIQEQEKENLQNNNPTQNVLPFIPLRDTVVFPSTVTPLNLGREISISAAEHSLSTQDKLIVVSCQKKT